MAAGFFGIHFHQFLKNNFDDDKFWKMIEFFPARGYAGPGICSSTKNRHK
jgi:hypothetical protein